MDKKRDPRGLLELINLNLGLLGIQFAWGVQIGFISAVFEIYGATPEQIPGLWVAAPLSGLLIQPVVGHLSDKTWITWLGKRRPYLLGGALFAALALAAIPFSTALAQVAFWVWVLDVSLNVSVEPYRALISDQLPEEQHVQGFAIQATAVSLGAILATSAPWALKVLSGVSSEDVSSQTFVENISGIFLLGAVVLLFSMVWTIIFSSEEYVDEGEEVEDLGGEIKKLLFTPGVWRLFLVQCVAWLGIYSFMMYFSPAVPEILYGALDPDAVEYARGVELAGLFLALNYAVSLIVSLLIPRFSRWIGNVRLYSFLLLSGAVAFLLLPSAGSPLAVSVLMIGTGALWAGVISLPYSLYSSLIASESGGLAFGVFNICVVIPQLLISFVLTFSIGSIFHGSYALVLMAGGIALLCAAGLAEVILDGSNEGVN